MPPDLEAELLRRVREQIRYEADGDVSGLYEMTVPGYRKRRIEERDDEPGLSLREIREFVDGVDSAEITFLEIDACTSSATQRPGRPPVARVLLGVKYNGDADPVRFRTVWVYEDGQWYTTALRKVGPWSSA